MARGKKKAADLTPEEKLKQALVPVEEQPYKVPENWCWTYGSAFLAPMESQKPKGDTFRYIDIDSIDNKRQEVTSPKEMLVEKAPSRASRKLHSGDTVFSMVRPYLKNIAYIDESISDSIASTGFYICSPKSNVNPRFNYYLMTSSYVVDGLNSFMKGDNSPSIRGEHIEKYPYPIPPLPEQRRIVDRIESIFAKLDEAKEKAQEVIDGFELRKSAILHKAFTGELIGLRSGDTIPLETIVDTIRIGPFGSALHKEDYVANGIPVINPKHISNQHITADEKVSISATKANELNSYRLKAGDIIMGRRGEMGRSAPVSNVEAGWLCGTGSLIIRLKNGYDANFYSMIIGSHSSIQYLEENCVGSTMKNLNEKVIKSLPVPNYSMGQQQRIVSILDNLLAKEAAAKAAAEAVLDQIDTMKKAVLARAFRGELGTNVPEEESAVELLKSVL